MFTYEEQIIYNIGKNKSVKLFDLIPLFIKKINNNKKAYLLLFFLYDI